MRIPTLREIPELDRQAVLDDVEPYRGMTTDELDEVRHGLCRIAAENWERWPAAARTYQDPISPATAALWARLVRGYRSRGTVR